MPSVDVLVVGAGPAGCVAAWHAALAGRGGRGGRGAPGGRGGPGGRRHLEVLLIERDRAVGAPVRCAEGVGSAGLREFLSPDGADWVSRQISRVVLVAPDDTEVPLGGGEMGYVLDRTRFEPALAAEAARAGAEIRIGTEATGLARADGGWRVRLRGPGGEEEVGAKVVIGADGVEAMVGRWAGIDTRVASRDMESCAQYVVTDIAFDPDAIYLQFGRAVAPGGYAWIFPKGARTANVGLGIVTLRADGRTAVQYLDRYLERRYPGGVVTGRTVGGVIAGATLRRTVADGVLVAGDAAHMINPLSGAGIVNAMKAGRLAGRHAARAVGEGDTSARNLEAYQRDWMQLLGDDHLRYYRLKEAVSRFDDDFLNRLAHTLTRIPTDKRTLGRVFREALTHHPSLLPVAARFFV